MDENNEKMSVDQACYLIAHLTNPGNILGIIRQINGRTGIEGACNLAISKLNLETRQPEQLYNIIKRSGYNEIIIYACLKHLHDEDDLMMALEECDYQITLCDAVISELRLRENREEER